MTDIMMIPLTGPDRGTVKDASGEYIIEGPYEFWLEDGWIVVRHKEQRKQSKYRRIVL